VARLLVLWDVDYTLVDSDGVGRMLYAAAFRELFGREMPPPGLMSGRTDRAIALEVLTLAGLPEPQHHIAAFQAVQAARAAELAGAVLEHSRVLPGASAAIAALARLDGPEVVQSLLTGNIRPLAEVKLGPLGLLDHLDLDAGAYGDVHEVRAELVHAARRNAARGYGRAFAGHATVLVGDTPLDVEAALATGARAVGVATGSFTAPELAAAGAHAVLPDLSDTSQVLEAILAGHRSVKGRSAGSRGLRDG
jgi:phosphoglycolate phosphatase-like HAD superfamily hydrolase